MLRYEEDYKTIELLEESLQSVSKAYSEMVLKLGGMTTYLPVPTLISSYLTTVQIFLWNIVDRTEDMEVKKKIMFMAADFSVAMLKYINGPYVSIYVDKYEVKRILEDVYIGVIDLNNILNHIVQKED